MSESTSLAKWSSLELLPEEDVSTPQNADNTKGMKKKNFNFILLDKNN